MADRWIELEDGTIINLNNVIKFLEHNDNDDEFFLLDSSGSYTEISPSDKKRIIDFLTQNSCLELLTKQNNEPLKLDNIANNIKDDNPEIENVEPKKEDVPFRWKVYKEVDYILKSSLIEKLKEKKKSKKDVLKINLENKKDIFNAFDFRGTGIDQHYASVDIETIDWVLREIEEIEEDEKMSEKSIIDLKWHSFYIDARIKNLAKDLEAFIKSMEIYANEDIIIKAYISEKEACLMMLREIKDELTFLLNISNKKEANND